MFPRVSWACALAVIALSPVTAPMIHAAATPGDFIDDFERGPGALAEHPHPSAPDVWAVSGTMTADIMASIGKDDSNGLRLQTAAGQSGALQLDAAPPSESILYYDFYARLTPRSSDPVVPATSASAFYLTPEGDVRLRDGTTWISAGLDPALEPGTLHRFSLKQDFASSTWQLWINGERVTTMELGFAHSIDVGEGGLRVAQDGEAEGTLDQVSLLETKPADLSNAAPVAVADDLSDTPILAGESVLLDVTTNDTDPNPWDGDNLVPVNPTATGHGSAVVENGMIAYTADANAAEGTHTFQYQVSDGDLTSAPATVTVRIVTADGTFDGDADDLPDGFELFAYGDLDETGDGDFDGDGVSDLREVELDRNPAGIDRITLNPETDDFLDPFERGTGALAVHPGMWHFSGGASPQIKAGVGASGSQGLELALGTGDAIECTLHLPEHWRGAGWNQFKAILTPFADDANDPTVSEDAKVAFYLTESGDIRARDGANWVLLDFASGLDVEAMHTYTVRQDHLSETWKLWVDGDLATPSGLAFAQTGTRSGFFRIIQSQGPTAVFDDVAVSGGPPGNALADLKDYAAWKGAHDPGLSLLEYGFGHTEPGNVISTPMEVVGDEVTFSFQRNSEAEDLTFTVQTSPDLSPGSWTDLALGAADVTVSSSGGFADEVTVTLPPVGVKTFVRLQVDAP